MHQSSWEDFDSEPSRLDANSSPAFLAWHYTTGTPYLQIMKQHALVPVALYSLKPIVWFSVNTDFEPMACTTVRSEHGAERYLSVAETADAGFGLVRLGLPVRLLLTCMELRRRAGISAQTWTELCEKARECGSDPDQWFGSLHTVALRDLTVEVRDERGFWRRVQSGVPAAAVPLRTEPATSPTASTVSTQKPQRRLRTQRPLGA